MISECAANTQTLTTEWSKQERERPDLANMNEQKPAMGFCKRTVFANLRGSPSVLREVNFLPRTSRPIPEGLAQLKDALVNILFQFFEGFHRTLA